MQGCSHIGIKFAVTQHKFHTFFVTFRTSATIPQHPDSLKNCALEIIAILYFCLNEKRWIAFGGFFFAEQTFSGESNIEIALFPIHSLALDKKNWKRDKKLIQKLLWKVKKSKKKEEQNISLGRAVPTRLQTKI